MRRIVMAGSVSIMLLAGACGQDDSGSGADPSAAGRDGTPRQTPAANVAGSDLARPVDSETLPYADVDDQLVYGYFAFPTDMIEPLPAIIMIHDWWGLNDDVRATADKLATEGFMVLAIDLYAGETADRIEAARAKMVKVLEDPANVENNISQALEFVAIAGAPSTASLGYGLGGGWSLSAAALFPDEIDAAVIYYGQVSDDEDQLRNIKAPILGLFGAKDRSVTQKSVNAFEVAMQRLRKTHDVHFYPEAGHAFADQTRNNFRKAAADNAWLRTVEFLVANLAHGEQS